MAPHAEDAALAPGVNRDDNGLAAEAAGNAGDDPRVLEGRRVDGHLVRACLDDARGIVDGPDSSTDGKGNEDVSGDGADRLDHGEAPFSRRRDIEDHEFVNTLAVVAGRELRRIAGVAEPFEVDAFDDAAVANVETSNDAFGEGGHRNLEEDQ